MNRAPTLAVTLLALLSACGARSSDPGASANRSSREDEATDGGQGRESENGDADAGGNGSTGSGSIGSGSIGSGSIGSGSIGSGSIGPSTGNAPPGTTGSVSTVPAITATTPSEPSSMAPTGTVTVTPSPTVTALPPNATGTGATAPMGTAVTPLGDPEGCPSGTQLQSFDNTDMLFPGVVGFAAWGDGVTSMCLEQQPGRVCAYGTAVSSIGPSNDYERWGAGLSILLTPDAATGRDLASFGISKLQLTLSSVAGRPVRVMATRANDPALSGSNYSENAFLLGGSSPRNFTADTILGASFSDFKLPSWTQILDSSGEPAVGAALDTSQVSSLQVMIANSPSDEVTDYSYCIEDLLWLDRDDNQVLLPNAPRADVDGGSGESIETDEPSDVTPPAEQDAGAAISSDAGSLR